MMDAITLDPSILDPRVPHERNATPTADLLRRAAEAKSTPVAKRFIEQIVLPAAEDAANGGETSIWIPNNQVAKLTVPEIKRTLAILQGPEHRFRVSYNGHAIQVAWDRPPADAIRR